MKNNVNKGFLFYILILLGVIAGVACIFFSILIFSPGTSMFGLKYSNINSTETFTQIKKDDSTLILSQLIKDGDLEKITINCDSADVVVETKDIFNFEMKFIAKRSGFLKSKDQSEIGFTLKFNEESKELSVEIEEPDYLVNFNNNIQFRLALPLGPNAIDTSKLSLEVNTNDNYTAIGKHTEIDYTFNNIEINGKESTIDLGNHLKINGNLNITNDEGIVSIRTYDDNQYTDTENDYMASKNFTLHTLGAKIEIDNLKADKFEIYTNSSPIKIGKLVGNLSYEASKGVFILNEIIGNLDCKGNVKLTNFKVGTIDGHFQTETVSGDVYVEKITGDSSIESSKGNINISQNYGKLEALAKGGNINVTNFENAQVILSTTDGNINFTANSIQTKNDIKTESGDITINYHKNLQITFVYDCGKNPTFPSSIPNHTELGKKGTVKTNSAANDDHCISFINNSGKTNVVVFD